MITFKSCFIGAGCYFNPRVKKPRASENFDKKVFGEKELT